MSNSNNTQETLEIMKESEKKLVEESLIKNKSAYRTSSKEEVEKDGEDPNAQLEFQRRTQNHGHSRKRSKSNSKLKLVRSLAVCEESSHPFTCDGPQEIQDVIQLQFTCPSDKEEERPSKDGSEKEDKEKKEKLEKIPRKMLSRDSSQEYTDSTGIDLHEFLVNTLKNNPRDRMMLLKLEQEILDFISDNNNQYKKFPQMTSYHRMLLHRVAAYFGMDHNVDQTGKAVIINKTINTRIPEQRFSDHIRDEKSMDFQKRFILKRDDTSLDKDDNQMRVPLRDDRRSKSIEEREEEYQRVRDRIFARESSYNGCLMESRLSKEGSSSSLQKRRQLFRGNRECLSRASSSRQSSTENELKSSEPRPWSSTDSDSSNRSLKPPVTKASSFSGISILTRGDSIGSSKSVNRVSKTGLPLGAPELTSSSYVQASAQQPGRTVLSNSAQQQQLPPTPQQQPMTNHMMSQPLPSLQPSAQPIQYSATSCPQVLLPVSPPQQYTTPEDLGNQFGQMSLSRQGSAEAPETTSAVFQAPVISQQPGYIIASPGQSLSAPPYSTSGHPTAQQVLQPQGYIQPPQQFCLAGQAGRHGFVEIGGGYRSCEQEESTRPTAETGEHHSPSNNHQHLYLNQAPAQMRTIPVSYYPPGQYQSSNQQYRPLSQVPYNSQRSQQLPQPAQQTGLQGVIPNQQQTYQGMMSVQQPQTSGLMNNQRSNLGNQMQGMMVQYSSVPSYQVPMSSDSQVVVQQTYQQPVMVPSQSVQGTLPGGGVPVYYSVIPPSQQNSTSQSVGFLQPPGPEQYQMPQSPSPCNPAQMQQQYTGVAAPSHGVVVMQLSVPNGPQPPQPPLLPQWNQCKYYSMEQRGQKPTELYNPDNPSQVNAQLNSPLNSPTQSPTPSPVTNVCPGLAPLPLIAQFSRPVGPAQGDTRYSLLGQPLQYNLPVCPPPVIHGQCQYSTHQGPCSTKHTKRGKKPTLKSASTDLGTVVGRILEVTDLPEGITRTEADKLFSQLSMSGAKIQWLKDSQQRSSGSGDCNRATENSKNAGDLAALYTIVAVFPSTMAAQNATIRLNNSTNRFKLRTAKRSYDLRILERASSQ
ncbi:R3H domain-containing protein 2 isoform X2 [Heterodontus francisci]|uniref:R3H domain-containing protein 2 isoform X2 n=1 Tax=Heterodontus francisci TaxID=7792 RepID=UPI00355BC27E